MATTYVLPTRSRKELSHWPVYASVTTRQTDHWSKLRCKSYQLAQLPTGHYVSYCKPKESSIQGYARRSFGSSATTLASVGSSDMHQYLKQRLYGGGPRHRYTEHGPSLPSEGHRHRIPSASSQRAKRGYKYWHDVKPATPGTKATLGAKGNFLGIGIPRL